MLFRIATLLLLASALSISAYFRTRAARTHGTIERLAEGRGVLLARMGVALPLLVALLTYIVRPGWMEWSRIPLPPWMRWTALLVGIVAVAGSAWTLATLGGSISPTVLTREGQELVTRGPYRRVRHPLYASGILLLLSLGVMAENLFIVAWVLMGLSLVVFVVIPTEEEELMERFGREYAEYRERSGALLPLPRIFR